jgi:hypothetical protein
MRTSKSFWANVGTRIDTNLQYYSKSPKIHKNELTYEKAIELYVKIIWIEDNCLPISE